MSGRGKSRKTMEFMDSIASLLEATQPASVRAALYQAFVHELVKDTGKNSAQKVSRILVWARENDIVPWPRVVDEARAPERPGTWSNPERLLSAAMRQYRRNHWQDQPAWVEVWSEKGTVRGTLAPVLENTV